MSSIMTHPEPLLLLLLQIQLVVVYSLLPSAGACTNHTAVPTVLPCSPDQALALLRLKWSFSATNESITAFRSWRAGTDCCRWEGIRCRDANGRVTSLDLGDCGLHSGGIHPALFDLTSLEYLNLAYNNFNGSQLPSTGFERLIKLTHLNFSSSSFDGQARVQAVIKYHADYLHEKKTKLQARTIHLTREQYMMVVPQWCADKVPCWSAIVDKWCDPEYLQKHDECRGRRLTIGGPAHRQGNLSLSAFKQKWAKEHDGQEISDFKAYCESHKGKEPGQEWCNPGVKLRVDGYTTKVKEIHGEEYDPKAHPLDPVAVMMAGGGKKHGRYWLADGHIDTASTPTLSQIRARSTTSSATIERRPEPATYMMTQFQAQLAEERQRRELVERQAEAARLDMQAQLETQNQAFEARFAQQQAYLQELYALHGRTPPPMPSPPPPRAPLSTHWPPSAGSNEPGGGSGQGGTPTSRRS